MTAVREFVRPSIGVAVISSGCKLLSRKEVFFERSLIVNSIVILFENAEMKF